VNTFVACVVLFAWQPAFAMQQVTVETPVKIWNADIAPGVKSGGWLHVVNRTVPLLCEGELVAQRLHRVLCRHIFCFILDVLLVCHGTASCLLSGGWLCVITRTVPLQHDSALVLLCFAGASYLYLLGLYYHGLLSLCHCTPPTSTQTWS
jgi:hypothetical protein